MPRLEFSEARTPWPGCAPLSKACFSSGKAAYAPLRPRPHAPRQPGRAPRRRSRDRVSELPDSASTFDAFFFNASCQWPAAASTLATSFNAVRTISSSSSASRLCVSSDACDWHARRCSSASSSAVLHSSDPKAF